MGRLACFHPSKINKETYICKASNPFLFYIFSFVEFVETVVVSPISASRKSGSNLITNNNNIVNNINHNNNNNNNNNSINSNSSLTKSNSINKSRTSLNSSREDLDIIQTPPSSHHHPYSHNAQNNDAPLLPPKPIRELCKVLYAYSPANEDELKLIEGDIITIISKELPDKGWWKGELKGKVGVFPDNFVALLPPEGMYEKLKKYANFASNPNPCILTIVKPFSLYTLVITVIHRSLFITMSKFLSFFFVKFNIHYF